MPHIFGPKYLRVRTPKTTDGKTLEYDENSQLIYTETDLPLTARRALERENEKTPIPYRHKIIEIDEGSTPDPSKLVKGVGVSLEDQKEALRKKLAELESQSEKQPEAKAEQQEAPKRGRPAKQTADDLV